MRWAVFLFIVLCASIPLVQAEVLYSGKIYSGDNLTINNETFTVLGIQSNTDFELNYTSVVLTSLAHRYLISQENCYATDYYTYCYLGASYDYNNNKTLMHSGFVEPQMAIQVNHTIPEITVTRPTTIVLSYGLVDTIAVTIKNNGQKAGWVHYEEQLPPSIIVVNTGDFTANSELPTLLAKDILMNSGDIKTFYYTIKTLQYQNATWTGSYTYSYENITLTQNTTQLIATTKLPYNIIESYSKKQSDTISSADYTEYCLNITNTDPSNNLNLNASVDIGYLQYIEAKYWKNTTPSLLTYTAMLSPGETAGLYLRFRGLYTGVYPIKTTILSAVNNNQFSYQSTQNYTVKLPENITSTIVVNKNSVDAGEHVNITLMIKNNDAKNTYYNIQGILLEEDINASLIHPGEEIVVYQKDYTTPSSSTGTLNITFVGTYHTESGQGFFMNAEKIINITHPVSIQSGSTNNTQNTSTNTADKTPAASNSKNSSQNTTPQSPATSKTHSASSNTIPEKPHGFFGQLFYDIGDFFSRLFSGK